MVTFGLYEDNQRRFIPDIVLCIKINSQIINGHGSIPNLSDLTTYSTNVINLTSALDKWLLETLHLVPVDYILPSMLMEVCKYLKLVIKMR